jgi:RNA polymerase sigma factor (sigma-70 family)
MPSLQAIAIPEDVLAAARRGDALAHEALYRVLAKPVYTLIRRLVVRPAIAEELLQDTFIEILRSIGGFAASGSFLGWVRSIAVSKSLMYLRSPWHRSLIWLGADGVRALHEQAAVSAAESLDADLERALASLPAVSRAVVWLYDVEGFTHAEIAQHFGRTIGFSKAQLSRAHSKLREALETQPGGLACMPVSRNS